jgi:transposase
MSRSFSFERQKRLGKMWSGTDGRKWENERHRRGRAERERVQTVRKRGLAVGKSCTNQGAMHPTTVVSSPSMMN